jgi:hypothetical protein
MNSIFYQLSWKENVLFIVSSLILSFLILQYYIKPTSKQFVGYYILCSLVIYFVFVYITRDSNDLLPMELFTNGLDETNIFDDTFDEMGEEEQEIKTIQEEEEEIPIVTPTTVPVQKEEEIVSTIPIQEEEESKKEMEQPDINNIILGKPMTGNAYGPLNINVSYKTIGCGDGDDDKYRRCDQRRPHMDSINDLGKYNYKSRIHNNNQWMNSWESNNYGHQAWTNDPDYYIPPLPPNQVVYPRDHKNNVLNYHYNKKKEKCSVCPLEINTPWSEYKSGDIEDNPKPYNM